MSVKKSRLDFAKKILQVLYTPEGKERVGFILPDSMVEVNNIADKPTEGFFISPTDILLYTEEKSAWATWHTHPGEDSNLSGEDYIMMKQWPDLVHFIVGNDGIKAYQFDYEKKAVMEIK